MKYSLSFPFPDFPAILRGPGQGLSFRILRSCLLGTLALVLSFSSTGAVSRAFPDVQIAAVGGSAFSPNGDGFRDVLELDLNVREGKNIQIVDWQLDIIGSQGLVRSFVPDLRVHRKGSAFLSGEENESHAPPRTLWWDGRDEKGRMQADGRYRIDLRITYSYNHMERHFSGEALIDTALPSGSVKPIRSYVVRMAGPDGRLMLPTGEILIEQTPIAEPGLRFLGHIIDGAGRVVESRRWENSLPAKIAWNGIQADGEAAPPGVYRYELEWSDAAGNRRRVGCQQLLVLQGPVPPVQLATESYFIDDRGMSQKGLLSISHTGKERPSLLILERLTASTFGGQKIEEVARFRTTPVANLAAEQRFFAGLQGGFRLTGRNERGLTVTNPLYFSVDSSAPILTLSLDTSRWIPSGHPLRLQPVFSSSSPLAHWSVTCFVDTGVSRRLLRVWKGEGLVPPAILWQGDLDGYTLSGGERVYFEFQATNLAGRSATVRTGPLVTGADLVPVSARSTDLVARFVISDSFREAGLSKEGGRLLDEIASMVVDLDHYELRVRSFVSFQGEEEENLMRSERIARAVRDALVERGIAGESASFRGEGETDLISEADDDFSTYRNNRLIVEVRHRGSKK